MMYGLLKSGYLINSRAVSSLHVIPCDSGNYGNDDTKLTSRVSPGCRGTYSVRLEFVFSPILPFLCVSEGLMESVHT